ncbi:MAG: hypothetical protein ACRDRL_32880 [Sciscionella sp.]
MHAATHYRRPVIAALLVGLALTVITLIGSYLDRTGIAGHIHAGYPNYAQAQIDTAVRTYLIILTIVGVLGLGCWLTIIWAVNTGKRWVRWVATGIFAIATTLALTLLLIKDTSGDTGLPPLLGWTGLLPCVAGLLAVGLLHRHPPSGPSRMTAR